MFLETVRVPKARNMHGNGFTEESSMAKDWVVGIFWNISPQDRRSAT